MAWLILIPIYAVVIIIPVGMGLIFRICFKKTRPGLLAFLAGTVLFLGFNTIQLKTESGNDVSSVISQASESAAQGYIDASSASIPPVPYKSMLILLTFIIVTGSILPFWLLTLGGIKLTDKIWKTNPNHHTHSITASGGSE